MAFNLNGEVSLNLRGDGNVTYGQLEQALSDAGFTEYVIGRQRSGDGTDLQLIVRPGVDDNGNMQQFAAVQTLTALTDAVEAAEAAAGGTEPPAE